jgi:hypothetical protein
MLRVLRAGDVEIDQATAPFLADGVDLPEGSFVVRMGQPFGGFAKTLLEVQHYPNLQIYPGGPPKPPYDITAHTLPLQMGVQTIRVEQPFDADLVSVSVVPIPSGGVTAGDRSANTFLIGAETNASAQLVNRLLSVGARVGRATRPVHAGDELRDAGAFVVTDVRRDIVDRLARELGLTAFASSHGIDAPVLALTAPRIGLYRSWRPNAIDEGWTRYVLERYEFPFQTLRDREIRQGDLRAHYDVIILPHQIPRDIVDGNSAAEYPPEFAGGIGELGAANLRRFVEAGGTLVTLDGACDIAIKHLYLPVTNVLEGLRPDQFFSPGSLLRLLIDPSHPVGWGFEREAVAMFVSSPAFDVKIGHGNAAQVVAQYPLSNQLLSGWITGAEQIAGRAAIVDVPVGTGRAILIGLRPQFRAQARGSYRLLFNAIYAAGLERDT